MHTPSTIKWIRGLTIVQLIFSVLAFGLLIALVAMDGSTMNPLLAGLKDGFVGDGALTLERLGELSFMPLFVLVIDVLILRAISRRSSTLRTVAAVLLWLTVLSALGNQLDDYYAGGNNFRLPIVSIVIGALFFAKSAREYFAKKGA